MRVLADLGVRIENVWAIEQDREAHGAALERARTLFPALKIFHGGFEQFIRVVRERFDVVYLDFTAPLPSASSKPYRTLHAVFDEQVLENLAALVVNVGDLAPDEGSVQFLADYFRHQPFVESNALGYCAESDPDALWYAEVAPDQWSGQDDLRKDIEQRIDLFYSAFCTQYPSLYANRVQPALRLLRTADARRSVFQKDPKIYDKAEEVAADPKALLTMFSEHSLPVRDEGWGPGMDFLLSPQNYPLWRFLESLKERVAKDNLAVKWLAEFSENLASLDGSNYKPSRLGAVHLSDLLWCIDEGYLPLMADQALAALVSTYRKFPDRKTAWFCDLPMLHLIAQLALNQLGYPYHPVLDRHWRAKYMAKSTNMYLDVHVYDQCRPLYDYLPALQLFPEHFGRLERQFIARIGMSAIGGQAHGVVPGLYWASALADRYSYGWSQFASPVARTELTEQV